MKVTWKKYRKYAVRLVLLDITCGIMLLLLTGCLQQVPSGNMQVFNPINDEMNKTGNETSAAINGSNFYIDDQGSFQRNITYVPTNETVVVTTTKTGWAAKLKGIRDWPIIKQVLDLVTSAADTMFGNNGIYWVIAIIVVVVAIAKFGTVGFILGFLLLAAAVIKYLVVK